MATPKAKSIYDRIKAILDDKEHPLAETLFNWDEPSIDKSNKIVQIPNRNDSIYIGLKDFENQAEQIKSRDASREFGTILTSNYYYQMIADPNAPGHPDIGTKFDLDGYDIEICSTDLIMYHCIVELGAYDKYYDPRYNYALRIKSVKKISREEGENIFGLCGFEYNSSTGNIITNIPFYDGMDYSDQDETEEYKMRPLERWNEGISLFNSAVQANDPEIRLLGLYKVLEYFAEPILNLGLYEQIRRRLDSSDALKPSGAYIKLIVDTVKSAERRRNDKELIRNVFVQCIDIVMLLEYLPKNMIPKDITVDSKKDSIDKFAIEIADIATATRNQFAHAKSNYISEGKECPSGDLIQFNEFMRKAAIGLIRWYNRLPDHQRVLNP